MSCCIVSHLSCCVSVLNLLPTFKNEKKKENSPVFRHVGTREAWRNIISNQFESICGALNTVVVLFSVLQSWRQHGGGRNRICCAGLWAQRTRSTPLWLSALRSLFVSFTLPGRRKAGFFIWMRTVSSGFAEVLVSCWFSFLPTYFGTAISSTNLNTNKRGVPPNAGTVCGEFICHLPALQHCTAEWHFFQKTGLEQTCHVCLHMNNPSLLMSARCINHDNPSCSTTKHR